MLRAAREWTLLPPHTHTRRREREGGAAWGPRVSCSAEDPPWRSTYAPPTLLTLTGLWVSGSFHW